MGLGTAGVAAGGTPGARGAAALILHPAAQMGGKNTEIGAVSSPSLEGGQEARGIEQRSGGRPGCVPLRFISCGDVKESEVCCQLAASLAFWQPARDNTGRARGLGSLCLSSRGADVPCLSLSR